MLLINLMLHRDSHTLHLFDAIESQSVDSNASYMGESGARSRCCAASLLALLFYDPPYSFMPAMSSSSWALHGILLASKPKGDFASSPPYSVSEPDAYLTFLGLFDI
jgi:hypothetical protein